MSRGEGEKGGGGRVLFDLGEGAQHIYFCFCLSLSETRER